MRTTSHAFIIAISSAVLMIGVGCKQMQPTGVTELQFHRASISLNNIPFWDSTGRFFNGPVGNPALCGNPAPYYFARSDSLTHTAASSADTSVCASMQIGDTLQFSCGIKFRFVVDFTNSTIKYFDVSESKGYSGDPAGSLEFWIKGSNVPFSLDANGSLSVAIPSSEYSSDSIAMKYFRTELYNDGNCLFWRTYKLDHFWNDPPSTISIVMTR